MLSGLHARKSLCHLEIPSPAGSLRWLMKYLSEPGSWLDLPLSVESPSDGIISLNAAIGPPFLG